MSQSGTQEPPIPKQNENGEGKVFYYGLIGTKDYYHKKNVKGKFSSGRFSSSDNKTQDLRPSKVYVSTSPAIRTSQGHYQYNRGGIVKLRQRKVKVSNRTYIEKVIVIQQWWKTVITRRTLLLSIKSQKEKSLLETEGGIISLSKERTHRFEMNTQETPITKKIVLTTDYNIDSAEKKPQLKKGKEEENNLMIKKVLPYSIDKVIKTNYDQYCQEYVCAQIKTKTPKEKTPVLKSQKKPNDKALRSQMRELWIKESAKEASNEFSIKKQKKPKEFSCSLVLQSRDHFDIKGIKTIIESIGSNTINWNEEVRRDSEIQLYLQRVYKMKNWNKVITKDKFSFDLIKQYDEIKSNVYITPIIKKNYIQNQINYIQSQCNSININGQAKPNWNQSNFAERIEISVKHSKSKAKLSITPKPLSITYEPTELYKDNIIYGIILTKEQLKQREKQLKIQHDQSNITFGPTYIYNKWNKVNKKYSEQSQKVAIKALYKKSNWNKTNNTSNIITNELLGRERERQMNQYIPNVQFMIETNPLIKVQKWKEIVNKTKQDSFNINRLYSKSDWNKTNKKELLNTFNEKGVEKDMKFLEDLFFSISAKKNDYEIIFTDKEKGKLFKLTKKDVMHLWNKMNKIDRINHDKCFISKEDEPKIIEFKAKFDEEKYVPQPIERVKAAPGKRRDDDDLEIAEGTYFSFIHKPKAVKPISKDNDWNDTCISENKSEHNIHLKGKRLMDKWNSNNKQSKDHNDIDYKGEDILTKWNKRNVQEKEKDNEISIKGISTIVQSTTPTTSMDVNLIYNMWNKKNKPTDKEVNKLCILGKDRKELWNEQNKKDNEHHAFIPTIERVKEKSHKRNKRSQEEIIINYKGEDYKDKWNRLNAQENSKSTTFEIKGIKGTKIEKPNYNILFEYWNNNNKVIKEENSIKYPGEHISERWNRDNELDNSNEKIKIKGLTYPNIFLVLQHWNKNNKAINQENDICINREDNYQQEIKPVKEVKLKASKKPNKKLVEEQWNTLNEIANKDIDILCSGERVKDKWNKRNKRDNENNGITIEGSTNPNIMLLLRHWNKQNKAKIEHNDLSYHGEDVKDKWNKRNKTKIEETNLAFIGDNIQDRWNRDNENEIQNTINIKGSKKPNIMLILEHWNKRSQIDNETKLSINGEDIKDKWNKKNKHITSDESNQIEIKGLKKPNYYILFEHWNKQNKTIEEENELCIIGESHKDKWNKLNDIDNELNQVNVKGSNNPNLILVWEYRMKQNKKVEDEIQFSIMKEDIKEKWNKVNELDTKLNNISLEGSREPNLMLVLERWNKRKKIDNESDFIIHGEEAKDKWNKRNKHVSDNEIDIKGLRKPNICLIIEHWQKQIQKIEEENSLCFIGESQKDKWNKRSKPIEEETKVCVKGEDNKDKWNRLNKQSGSANEISIKGSKNPNLFLILRHWNKNNKQIEEENELCILGENVKDKWNKNNAQENSQETNIHIKGSRKPNKVILVEYWNSQSQAIDKENELSIKGRDIKDKWNQNNAQENSQEANIHFKGSRKPNKVILVEYWNKQIEAVDKENDLCLLGEDAKDKWNKKNAQENSKDTNIQLEGLRQPNKVILVEYWNKKNKKIEEENELCILGEDTKDKWNKNNAQENAQENNIHFKGSNKPNKVILVEYWNSQIQAIDKETSVCLLGEDTKDKWNKKNAQENSQDTNIHLKGSRKPNKVILVEYWNSQSQAIDKENELCLLGEDTKDKWNKNNAQENSQETNIHLKGSRKPNKVILVEYWNSQIQAIDKENSLCLLGEDAKDKWNKNNAQENSISTNIQLDGSKKPNKVILVEYWQHQMKAIDKENELCLLGEDTKDKWNKNNAQENSQETNIHLKGSRKPNKVILVEYWNSQIEAVDKENSITIKGENVKDKWNKRNKQDTLDNSLLIKGSPDYNTYFILNQWKKRNIAETEKDNQIDFIRETHKERWNREISPDKHHLNIKGETNRILEQWKKRNKIAEEENSLSIIGKHNKDKWNEDNKFDKQHTKLDIEGLTNPNIYLILQHWLRVNKKIEEENEVCILAEDQSNKWNKDIIVDTQSNDLTYKGSKSPNFYLILQYWIKKNSIDENLNEVHYSGQDSKDKWNKKNKQDTLSNDIFIEGSSEPNIYLLLRHWNLKNKKEERQTELSYLGKEKKKVKENNWNDTTIIESSNEVKLYGSNEPNIWLIFEKWKKKNKLSETLNVLNYNRDAHHERWNKTNIQEDDHSAKVNFIGEPCKIPHLELVAELWKNRNKRCNDDNQIQYKGVSKQSDWNKTNKKVIEISGFDIDNEYEPDRSQTTIHVLKTVKKTAPKPKEITLDFASTELCIESKPKTKLFPIIQQVISMNEELELIPPKEKPTRVKAMPSIRKEPYAKVSNAAFEIPKCIKPMNIHRIPSMTIEKVTKVKRTEQPPYIIEPTIQEQIYKTKSVNPMRFVIYDTWRDNVAKEQSLSFNIKGEQQKSKPIVIGKGIDNIKPADAEKIQLLGKAKAKEIKDMTPFKLDGLEILNHKKKTRLNENKEKHNWDKEPLIYQNEPLELFSDESEELKEKKEKLRRKNVIKNMIIEQNSDQLLSSPKRAAFAKEKLLATNSEFKIDSKGKESILLLWNKRNKIKEENKDFHISKDYDRPIQWNNINAVHSANTYCINKKPKKSWNEQLEKNTNDILIPPQPSSSKWNKKITVNNFVYQIKGKSKSTWNDISKIETSKGFNIKEKPLKDKWNKNNTDSSSVTYTIQGTPRSKKWIKDNALTKMQYSSIGVPKPVINKWLSSNKQSKDTRFNILSKSKKPNEIKKESDIQMISKPKKRASNKLINSSSFTIDPNKKIVLAKVNQKNKIAKSVVNETIKGQPLKKQWSTKTLLKQKPQSMEYQGKEKDSWNTIVRRVTKEKMTLERIEKNRNDLFEKQHCIKYQIKPTQMTKKKTIIPLSKNKEFEYQYPDPNSKKDPSLLIRYTISEEKKKEMDDEDDDDNIINQYRISKKIKDKIKIQTPNHSKPEAKEEREIIPVNQQTDIAKVRVKKTNKDKEFSGTVTSQQQQNYANKQKEYEDSSGRKTDNPYKKNYDKGGPSQNDALKSLRNSLYPSLNNQANIMLREPVNSSVFKKTDSGF